MTARLACLLIALTALGCSRQGHHHPPQTGGRSAAPLGGDGNLVGRWRPRDGAGEPRGGTWSPMRSSIGFELLHAGEGLLFDPKQPGLLRAAAPDPIAAPCRRLHGAAFLRLRPTRIGGKGRGHAGASRPNTAS